MVWEPVFMENSVVNRWSTLVGPSQVLRSLQVFFPPLGQILSYGCTIIRLPLPEGQPE